MNLIIELSAQGSKIGRTIGQEIYYFSDPFSTSILFEDALVSNYGTVIFGRTAILYSEVAGLPHLLKHPVLEFEQNPDDLVGTTIQNICLFLKKLVTEAEIQSGLKSSTVSIRLTDGVFKTVHATQLAYCFDLLGLKLEQVNMANQEASQFTDPLHLISEFRGMNSVFIGIKEYYSTQDIECVFEKGCRTDASKTVTYFCTSQSCKNSKWGLAIYKVKNYSDPIQELQVLTLDIDSQFLNDNYPIECKFNYNRNGILDIKITDWMTSTQVIKSIFIFDDNIQHFLKTQEKVLGTLI
jgi:hypothetical protein